MNENTTKLLENIVLFTQGIKEYLEKIKVLEEKMEAMQNSNNQLADMAFDENKFTQELFSRCEELAEKAAKDAVDIDDIASEVSNNIDISEDVQRAIERLDLVDRDGVDDIVGDRIRDEDFQTESDVESLIENYLVNNDYVDEDYVEQKVEDIVLGAIDQVLDERMEKKLTGVKEEITQAVIAAIINKLTGKETHHADNSNHNSVSVSGVIRQSEIQSNGQTLS